MSGLLIFLCCSAIKSFVIFVFLVQHAAKHVCMAHIHGLHAQLQYNCMGIISYGIFYNITRLLSGILDERFSKE